jgi:hypothetical protein
VKVGHRQALIVRNAQLIFDQLGFFRLELQSATLNCHDPFARYLEADTRRRLIARRSASICVNAFSPRTYQVSSIQALRI